jgi:hypothetical protein
MPRSTGTIPISNTRNKGALYPLITTASAVAAVPAVITSAQTVAPMAQVLGLSTQTLAVAVPVLAAGVPQNVSFAFALKAFPAPFSLATNATGYVFATCVLVTQPTDPSTIVALPALSLTFGQGGTSVPGSGVWSFRNLGSYQGLSVAVTVRVVSLAGAAAQTLSFLGQAQLVGVPPAT